VGILLTLTKYGNKHKQKQTKMEGLETAAPPVAAAPVAAAPVQVQAPPVAAAAPVAPMAGGGDSENFVDILKSFNWIEIGFGILGVTALLYTIHYYKSNIELAKTKRSESQNQIDELTMKIADIQSVLESKKNAPQVF